MLLLSLYPKLRNSNILNTIRKTHTLCNKLTFDYISDLHVDYSQNIKYITNQQSNILLLAGDIGPIYHPNVRKFLAYINKTYDKILYVPGNHEYDIGAIYKKYDVNKYAPLLCDLVSSFENIILLDDNIHKINNTIIVGTILWSKSRWNGVKQKDHNYVHDEKIKWLNQKIKDNQNDNIIVVTHYVPSFDLIEQKYKDRYSNYTDLFASDLNYMIKKPIKAWICGHTHSILEKHINDVYCGINAGILYKNNYKVKTFVLE